MSELVDTISAVAAFAERKESVVPQWGYVFFRKGEVMAQTPDLGMRAPIDLDIKCAVSAALLLKALKAVRQEPKFRLTKSALIIAAGKATAELPIFSTEDMPLFPKPPTSWQPADLRDAMRVAWACAEDITRPHLSGVSLSQAGVRATNGMALCQVTGTDFEKLLGRPILVLPDGFKDLTARAWVGTSDSHLFIAEDEQGTRFRACKLLGATFPSVDQVVAGCATKPSLTVDRAALLDVLKRVALSGQYSYLGFLGDKLSVESNIANKTTLFSFLDQVEVAEREAGFKDATIGLDLKLLIPMVEGATSARITLRAGGDTDLLMVQDGPYISLAMPYRL